jgi:hypothetical protein
LLQYCLYIFHQSSLYTACMLAWVCKEAEWTGRGLLL